MRHARPDYARIQDPAANPALVAAYDKAMDVLAYQDTPEALRALAELCRELSPTLAATTHNLPGHPIGVDEPVFLLRASDRHAPATVAFWANRVAESSRSSAGPITAKLAADHVGRMINWQRDHGAKDPDAPGE